MPTSPTPTQMSGFIMKAKTREGFALKTISELLSNQLKFPPFNVNSDGIYLRATDQKRTVLIDLELPRENFIVFKCPKPIHFVVNSGHFYKLLKAIKKKDSVTLFINERQPMQLGICVEQNDETGDKVTTYINITYIQPEIIALPEGYGQPIIETSKRFQKLKTLHSIGASEMKATVIGNSAIRFFVNGKNLFSREITIGEEPDDDEDVSESYTQTLATAHITQLTKCAGQSGNIQIYHHEELPMYIKMRTGTLGSLSVYIKSKELIEQLEEEDDEEVAEQDEQEEETTTATARLAIEDDEEEQANEPAIKGDDQEGVDDQKGDDEENDQEEDGEGAEEDAQDEEDEQESESAADSKKTSKKGK